MQIPAGDVERRSEKFTGQPAQILGLGDRGVLAAGKRADVLVIDRENLRTNENHIDPRVWPQGVEYVFVGGEAAVWAGEPTGARAGQIIKK